MWFFSFFKKELLVCDDVDLSQIRNTRINKNFDYILVICLKYANQSGIANVVFLRVNTEYTTDFANAKSIHQ